MEQKTKAVKWYLEAVHRRYKRIPQCKGVVDTLNVGYDLPRRVGEVWGKLVRYQAKYKPGNVYTKVNVDERTDVLGLLQPRSAMVYNIYPRI
ncbi:hypothetical protein N7527_008443 [Penicillium freii]|nr:hypothetical protein N7527_008443 [Penicillium freii]